jgi:3-oxoadipate enol-lactonase
MEIRRSNLSGPMSYRKLGGGPKDTLVLLHAFPLNSRMWEPQMKTISEERRIIAPDYPGFGNSPRTPAQPDMRYYAGAVLDLLDRLELEKVVLGGLSLGGYIAFECMKLSPERFSALVLADTRPDSDSEEVRATRAETARRVAGEGMEVLVETQMSRMLAKSNLRNQEITDRVRAMILETSPDGAVAALGAMRERMDYTPLLPEIRVPALVIGGEEDALSPPDLMAEMAAKIPDSRHVTLPGAGHLSNLEAPKSFNVALEEFLAEL